MAKSTGRKTSRTCQHICWLRIHFHHPYIQQHFAAPPYLAIVLLSPPIDPPASQQDAMRDYNYTIAWTCQLFIFPHTYMLPSCIEQSVDEERLYSYQLNEESSVSRDTYRCMMIHWKPLFDDKTESSLPVTSLEVKTGAVFCLRESRLSCIWV